jgi:hypothetical protein
MNRQQHWNQVYQIKGPQDVSWYQRRPELSLALIAASGLSKDAGIIDVGVTSTVWRSVRIGSRSSIRRIFAMVMSSPLSRFIQTA